MHTIEVEFQGHWELVAVYDDAGWDACMRDLSRRVASGQNARCSTDF